MARYEHPDREPDVTKYSASSASSLLPLDLWVGGADLLRGVPADLVSWLTEPGLMTDRIEAASGASAGLKVVDERLGFLSRDEQALLLAPLNSCFVREVELSALGQPWIFACSLIPDHTLEKHAWLAELGTSALGATLKEFPGLERGPFEFAPLPASHPLAMRAVARLATRPDVVWARRAWYGLRHCRLLIQEVFLPEIGRC